MRTMLYNTANTESSSPALYEEHVNNQHQTKSQSLANSAERSFRATSESPSLPISGQSNGTSRLFEMIRKETSSEHDDEVTCDRGENEDLTEEEAQLFQSLVNLSNNPMTKQNANQSRDEKRESRTKSSSTVDSETESQENTQVLAQEPAKGQSATLDYVFVPQSKLSLLGSSLRSDCATDVSQYHDSPEGSAVNTNDARVLGFTPAAFITPSSSAKDDDSASEGMGSHSAEPCSIAAFCTEAGTPAQRQDFATSMLDAMATSEKDEEASIFAQPGNNFEQQ